MVQNPLMDQILEISQDYLGPAAERFIDRQVAAHLHKKPDRVTKEDLVKLIDWLKLSFSLLTDDSRMVNEYISRLRRLASNNGHGAAAKDAR